VADDLYDAVTGHQRSILKQSAERSEPRAGLLAQAPNALSISRFAMAALWIALAIAMPQLHIAFAILAIAAAVTDYIDGRIARRLRVAYEGGGWLDSVADVTFILAALGSYAASGELPLAVPVLIAISFAQYTIDSLWMHRARAPVRSRLGHWGGIINYGLVLAFALSAGSASLRATIVATLPLIELFYGVAIIERSLGYRRAHEA
jgi:phosphatidylglycerophosphate synthase